MEAYDRFIIRVIFIFYFFLKKWAKEYPKIVMYVFIEDVRNIYFFLLIILTNFGTIISVSLR
jgi:hypothetical protein